MSGGRTKIGLRLFTPGSALLAGDQGAAFTDLVVLDLGGNEVVQAIPVFESDNGLLVAIPGPFAGSLPGPSRRVDVHNGVRVAVALVYVSSVDFGCLALAGPGELWPAWNFSADGDLFFIDALVDAAVAWTRVGCQDDESPQCCSVDLRGAGPAALQQYMAKGGKGKCADREEMIIKGKGGKSKCADREDMIMKGKGQWIREYTGMAAARVGTSEWRSSVLSMPGMIGSKLGELIEESYLEANTEVGDCSRKTKEHMATDVIEALIRRGVSMEDVANLAVARPRKWAGENSDEQ